MQEPETEEKNTQDPQNKTAPEDSNDDPQRLVISGLIILVLVVGVFILLFWLGQDWFIAAGAWLKQHFGLLGIGIFGFLVDMIPTIISPDVIFAFTTDWPIISLLLVMSTASVLGGMSGFFIAQKLGHFKRINNFVSNFSPRGQKLIKKYGVVAIILAALTPIPYAHVCWIAGLMGMSPSKVFIGSLFRFPRMIIYYFAINGGISLFT